jgi:hypothetical protein
MKEKLALGSYVKDVISGFQGNIIARAEYVDGYVSLAIQPRVSYGNRIEQAVWFPENRVILVETDLRSPVTIE